MKVKFDSLNRFEVPKFFVCSPGSQYKSGLLTNVLGCLSDTSDEELVLNFGAMSELNFRINRIKREDPDENAYTLMLYRALQNRRLIFVEDVGYFSISSVSDEYVNGIHYKDIKAESCEVEIQNKLVPYIEDGTYLFTDLLEKIVSVLPMWTIGEVNGDVAKKYRTFEGVSVELNALAFLQENMQDAYECIFHFDTINRRIDVYDQNNYFAETQIHITKADVINTLTISEGSEDLYTALNVKGDENLNISPVNPIGTNVLYNFDYYLGWMTDSLREKVVAWQDLVASKESEYYDLNLAYYENLTSQSDLNSEIERINIQIEMYQRCRENIVASGSTVTVPSYNEVIEENGGVPVGVQNELADTLSEIDTLIANAKSELALAKANLEATAAETSELLNSIVEIHDSVAITSYFTEAEYNELSNYIYEGSYTDEYISVTSIMTYSEKFQQMKTLYDRAVKRLGRVSEPTQEFSMDVENFLFAKEFEEWSEQLETGCLINVELETDDVALLFLSNITVNYSDKSLQMTFGNRFSRFDPKAIFNGVLGDIKKSTNSINYIKEILYPVKDGEFDMMKEAIESSGILTKNAALASTNQEIIIDDTGILGRTLLDNGEYDPKQIKITNQTIVFTDDGWETANTAIGSFLFNNPFTGEVEERYGVIADTLIGSIVLSEEVGIYNTNNSITLDSNGFTLTSDYTSNDPSRMVFTIQKKLLDNEGNEYYSKQLYIDDDGNVVLNGSITIFSGSGSNNTSIGDIVTSVEANDSKIKDLEDELKTQADAIAGIDGIFFFVRYSDNEDGVPMYESPTDSTSYMGTCSTNTDVAPTDPSEYTWVRLRVDPEAGAPGVDGTSQYFHIKYSNDGETFTDNNGEDLGDWMGTCVTQEEPDPTDFYAYEWHKIRGEPGTNGLDGKDGIAGKDGSDGKTTYFHVKYSNIADPKTESDMSEEPSKYIGTYVDYVEADSVDPADYKWVKFMGEDGIDGQDGQNGIPGTNGVDGKTYYLHIKYSNDGGNTFTDNNGEVSGEYIGVYTDTTEADSTDVSDYKWSLIKGADGSDGTTYYTWIKYADTPTSGMSDNPDGKKYMGLAYNKTTSTESTVYDDYTWSLIKGEDGTDGVNGINGIDGKTYYTWVKYADDASGTNMTDDPTGKDYIGLAYNKDTSTESNNPDDYSWALFKGSDGVDGADGADGVSCYFYVRYSANADGSSMTTSPTDTTQYMGVCSTTSPSAPTSYKRYTWTRCKGVDGTNGTPGEPGADGRTQYLHIKYSDDGVTFTDNDGEDLGAYIGTLVDFVEEDSTTFSDYTWKKFTEDVDEELSDLRDRIDSKTEDLSNTIENNKNDLQDAIQSESDELRNEMNSKFDDMNNSVNEQINSASSAIDGKYATIIAQINDQLEAHKADVGQYMQFNDDGLTLGATTSDFKTVIDNKGLYFKQGSTIVSYVNNNQLYIPNAVIESTLILGNFFFSPREDGGVSLTWQE